MNSGGLVQVLIDSDIADLSNYEADSGTHFDICRLWLILAHSDRFFHLKLPF